jgi:Protein of unknown function (DUF4435)
MTLTYPKRARRAFALLMRPYNDIDIYVEDRTLIGVYEALVNNCLNGSGRVTRVIPLGPKHEVIAAAENDNDNGSRPRLYIVDGDLDIISSLRHKRINRLHRLRVYSLENLLYENGAVENYCKMVCPGMGASEAIRAIKLDEIKDTVEKVSRTYIAALAVARRLDLRGGEYAFDYKSIFVKRGGYRMELDRRRLRAKTAAVISTIKIEKGAKVYRRTKKLVFKAIVSKKLEGFEYFPGKGLLWHLNERAGAAGGASLQQRVIASLLAQKCSLSLDLKLARRIRRIARSRTNRSS